MTAISARPGILDIAPYVGGKSRLPGIERPIRLASNESALGPSPHAVEAFRGVADELHRYPDGEVAKLREAIGARFGLPPERIVCGNGSDELLALLAHAYAGPGDEVLYSAHGFLMYPILARGVGATPVAAPETGLRADVDALLERVGPRTRVLFLANPNNPTGSYLDRDEMHRLRSELGEDVLLVIDAAYAEFVTAGDYSPGLELVDAGANVVMTRTFSKIFALSALRLGWAYCPPGVADALNRLRAPFNVNAAAQAAGVAAIEDVAFTEAARDHNETWRGWLAERLAGLGLQAYPSITNFLLVRFGDDPERGAAAADRFLREKGIILRPVENYGLADCLRVTIGLEEEMRALVDALEAFVKRS
ncbi:MAG: histidinol-phosphate transaminase [Alphaproteobacteria bacterium]